MKRSGIITLLTDFGLEDPYVAMMKGVILAEIPAARVVDMGHQVKPGAVSRAAAIILETFPYFPEGTVHLVVVDPGVGTERRPIIVEASSHLFVGPDNGVFWPLIRLNGQCRIVQITETRYFRAEVSRTFHGRDIFAPVAAHLSRGADPLDMGPIIADPVRIQVPAPYRKGGTLYGHVIRVDHFGNLITDIRFREIKDFAGDRGLLIRLGDLVIKGVRQTYADAPQGEVLCLFGSSGYLEIAVNQGRASDRIGLDEEEIIGSEVRVTKVL
ncbi:MAG: SAM-dependent chlorinase/fluorinase [Deltaproteobacteria bacterium]|nr:SAM-dependent chlorinase/fluorinase [Deltaproteobacteria bacterium]MBW2047740.1 SAM-dependent chlorinase/fluorinase [Deltaproteobacteria bacterium]MBW2110383.1 SAM-dependent chlorinase/fluorinase [Deltaproteobacteria bacterium]MBW2354536.1 SAM-dependent chlorinase/fluorinase [Deltaproteobacteria bacterium]HDZ90080.1 hypothetical protein [Deltaproteobacteria bacterium]